MTAHPLPRMASPAPAGRTLRRLGVAGAALLALALSGCGGISGATGGGGGSSSSRTYIATQSSGDVFVIKVGGGAFDIDDTTTGDAISGNVDKLANQFQRWVVTDSTDPGVPTDGTGIAYALEIRKVALMLQPSGNDSDMIVGFSKGSCPNTGATYDWVVIPEDGWTTSSEAWGTAISSVSGSSISFQVTSYDVNNQPVGGNPDSGTCSGGKITLNGGATITITEAGAFMGSNGNSGGGFLGMVKPASDVSKSAVTASGIEYRGLVFKNQSAGDDTEPIWTRPKSDGVLEGGGYDDFENNVESADTATLDLGTQTTAGVFSGTISLGGQQSNMIFMINRIDDLYMIFGIATDPTDGNKPFNVLVIQVQ